MSASSCELNFNSEISQDGEDKSTTPTSQVHTLLNRITTTNIQNKNNSVAITKPSQEDTQTNTIYSKGSPINTATTSKTEMNTDGAFRNSEPQDQSKIKVKDKNARSTVTKAVQKRKLCIVSTNKRNKILDIAKKTFQNYEICHYVSPNCGTQQLISNLDKKLIDYTTDDFCVILIGEKDFYKTDNYVDIIIELRETLQNIQNTNIIICVPTFKLSNYSTLFNWRIETFNNLLHLDLQTYNYATAFDSNLDLCYDFTMFSKFDRKINNHGMRNIFHNLSLTIADYSYCQPEMVDDNQTNLSSPRYEFFR